MKTQQDLIDDIYTSLTAALDLIDANSRLDHEASVKKLAKMFSWELRCALTEEEMAEVIEANREPENVGTCASHDVCDANMVMIEAWTKFFGVDDINFNDNEQCRLWNEAWDLAKADEFAVKWQELDR